MERSRHPDLVGEELRTDARLAWLRLEGLRCALFGGKRLRWKRQTLLLSDTRRNLLERPYRRFAMLSPQPGEGD